ncbi:MAG: BON domain-containing protein [Vicinamibacterales bacterium]
MHAPQLLVPVAAVLLLGVACNRADDLNTRAAREEARETAAAAGDRLADAWLATKIQAQFFADDDIRGRDVSVTADDGVVTLRGRVPDENAHTQAVQTARNTDGVARLNDELTIGLPTESPGGDVIGTAGAVVDDARITGTIQSKFFLDDQVKGRRIDVDTRAGVVTLRGEVASEAERAEALTLARSTEGVSRVEDSLTVDSSLGANLPDRTSPGQQLDDATITTKIQAKYFLDRDVKAGALDVSTTDGVVLLEGVLPSPAARDRALAIARETEGVVQVVDRVRVE